MFSVTMSNTLPTVCIAMHDRNLSNAEKIKMPVFLANVGLLRVKIRTGRLVCFSAGERGTRAFEARFLKIVNRKRGKIELEKSQLFV